MLAANSRVLALAFTKCLLTNYFFVGDTGTKLQLNLHRSSPHWGVIGQVLNRFNNLELVFYLGLHPYANHEQSFSLLTSVSTKKITLCNKRNH